MDENRLSGSYRDERGDFLYGLYAGKPVQIPDYKVLCGLCMRFCVDRRTLYKKLTSGFGILESWRGMWYNTDKAPGRLKGEEASGAVNLYDLTEDIRLYFSNICCELEGGKISFCSFTARALPK